MAKKIIKKVAGVAGLVAAPLTCGASLALTGAALASGKSKKKGAAATAPTEQKGPIVTKLGDSDPRLAEARRRFGRTGNTGGTSAIVGLLNRADRLGG